MPGAVPERLLIAPIDLRTADPTVALDIYAGRWVFTGDGVDVDGFSVFDAEPPNEEWSRQLHGFGWLRHLRATDMALSRSNARSLVDEWIRFSDRHDAIAWEPGGRRPPRRSPGCRRRRSCSKAATIAFYRRFMRSLTRQVRYLRRVAYDGTPGLPRLRVMIALAAVGAVDVRPAALPQAGGPPARPRARRARSSPTAAISAAIPAPSSKRSSTSCRSARPSPRAAASRRASSLSAIDRMMPMLRFFRQGDGSFAHFNGMGDTRHRPAGDRARL